MHELLETETITASVLRYKLQYFPSDIKNEIQGTLLMSIIYFYFSLVLIHALFWELSGMHLIFFSYGSLMDDHQDGEYIYAVK